MHQGHLKASGSPLFLKTRYGNGYRVSLMRKDIHLDSHNYAVASNETRFALEAWINQCLPGCEVVCSSAGNITIGVHRNRAKSLLEFLKVLQRDELMEWTLSNSTLEEASLVFHIDE
jgi:hypothetical protein